MAKVLVCGDVHLDTFSSYASPVDNPASNSRLENILNALKYFFNYGVDNDVHNFVINGDLFNQRTNVNPSTYSYCISKVVSMINSCLPNTNVYFNVGNHDEYGRDIAPNSIDLFDSFSYSKGIHVYVSSSYADVFPVDKDSSILLVPYTENIEESQQDVDKSINQHSNTHLFVFAHLGLNNVAQGRWSHKVSGSYNIANLGWNNKQVTGINLAHYHTRVFIAGSDNSSERSAWYTGSLLPINFNDVDEDGTGSDRGFDLIDTISGSHEFINISNGFPKFNIIDIDGKEQHYEEVANLLTSNEDNYNKVIVHSDDAKDLVEKVKKDYELKNIKLSIDKKVKSETSIDISDNMSDSQIVSQYCEKYYPDVKKLALDYLEKARGI